MFSKKLSKINPDFTSETNQYEVTSTMSALKKDGSLMDIDEYCSFYKIPREHARSYKLVTHTGTPYYNIASNVISQNNFSELHESIIEDIKKHSPIYKKYKREENTDGYLLVLDPADIHIGKLCDAIETGDEYNNKIAVKRVLNGVDGILDNVKGFNVDKILFVIGNDVLHIDNPKRTTTSGTPQDTDGMWHTNFLIAKKLYVDVIERLLLHSDVHVVYNPSNHDYTNGFFLAQVIQAHFTNCSNITFDTSISHRKYYVYYDNLIGTTHGDGAKVTDLPLLMAHESKKWSECTKRYWYTHHLHHKVAKDYMGVSVETLRSPSGTDSWHSRNGYTHAPKAVEGFLHHKKHGQVARFTHFF